MQLLANRCCQWLVGSAAAAVAREMIDALSLECHTIALQEAMVVDSNSLLAANQDELWHIDPGVIITYRLLDGIELPRMDIRTREKTDDLRYPSSMAEREKSLVGAEEDQEAEERKEGCSLCWAR